MRLVGIGTNNNGVCDRDNFGNGQIGFFSMLANRFFAAGLIDAYGAYCAASFAEYVGAYPADGIRHAITDFG